MNKRLLYFLLFTVILAVFISPFASSSPDGLERVALDLGFMGHEQEPMYEVFPDYSVTIIPFDYFSTALSGLLGLLIIGLPTGVFIWMSKRRKHQNKACE